MASPYNDMLIAVLVGLGALVVLLGAVLYWRNRQLQDLRQVGDRVAIAARDGDLDMRFGTDAAGEDATELAQNVDRMMERLQREQETHSDREAVLRRLAESMNEAIAVERDGILRRQCPVRRALRRDDPGPLVGRRISDLVHPDFAELLAEHLRRHREGQPAPVRLEVELRPVAGHTPRLELNFARVSYDAQPALLVSAVEISSRAEQVHGGRARATAWAALDSLSEGVLTTDVDGRIVYVNRAGEALLGSRPMADAIGHTLGEVMSLVDEADRKTLGDPVRQSLRPARGSTSAAAACWSSANGDGERSIELTVSPMRDDEGNISGTVISLRDVSDLRGLTRQMSYQASHDALTGLVNRREFERRLQEALEAAHGDEHPSRAVLSRPRSIQGGQRRMWARRGDSMLREVGDSHQGCGS